jgi:hypothetical protein
MIVLFLTVEILLYTMIVASGLAVVITHYTMGKARISALIAFGYSVVLQTFVAAAVQGIFNGVHLFGVLYGGGLCYWAFVRTHAREYV